MFSACCRVAFINEYTRYCPKCGQECGIEYKETIPWIKCSERMPPDDETRIIVKTAICGFLDTKAHELYITNDLKSIKRYWQWIPYDEATWKELSK